MKNPVASASAACGNPVHNVTMKEPNSDNFASTIAESDTPLIADHALIAKNPAEKWRTPTACESATTAAPTRIESRNTPE
jgi:hypothetical protein